MNGFLLLLSAFSGAWAAPLVNLTIQERTGVDRLNEPILMGVPMPEKWGFTNPAGFTLRDQNGAVIPCEIRTAGTWLKNPAAIRWLHLDFTLDQLTGGAAKTVTVHSEPAPVTMSSNLTVSDGGTYLEVNTGVLKFRVKKGYYSIIDEAWVDESGAKNYDDAHKVVASHSRGLVHVLGSQEYLSSLDANARAVVERQGPHALCIKVTGILKSAAGDSSFHFISRLYAYHNSRSVKALHVIENWSTSIQSFISLPGFNAEIPLNLGASRTAVIGTPGGQVQAVLAAGDTAFASVTRSGGNFSPLTFATGGKVQAVSVNPVATHPRDVGWVSLSDGTRGAAVGRRYFWEMFPVSAEATGDGKLVQGLYSARQRLAFEFYAGVSRTFETRYVFFNDDPPAEQRSRIIGAMNPLYAIAPARWYCRDTKALGLLAEKNAAIFPTSTASAVAAIESKMTTNFSNCIAYLDNFPKYGNYNYGMLNWGDELHYVWDFVAGAGTQADWNLAWNGNYYGLDIMSFNHFLRTADPAILDYSTAHARYVEDVHQVHFVPGYSAYGGCRYCPPTNHIAADGLQSEISTENASHHKTEGMFANYFLLGSERALETAVEAARWIMNRYRWSFAIPGENLDTYVRRVSNLLHSQAAAYLHTKDRAHHTNMYQNWFFLKKDINDNETIGFKWQMGLLFEALVDMYYVCDDSIADSIPKYLKIQADRDLSVVDENAAIGYAFLSRFYGNNYLNNALGKLAGLGTSFSNYHKDLALSARSVERALYYLAVPDSVDNPPIGVESARRPAQAQVFSVRPNPVSGRATLGSASGGNRPYTGAAVFDMAGRQVAVLRPHGVSGDWVWDASRAAPGVYVVRGEAGGRRLSVRVAVVR